jgi:uncharacterized damage-inducible protein DinB
MSKIEELLQELNVEAETTRRVLERVPGDRLAWKPHARSMTLGQLALHVATIPGAIAEMSRQSPFPVPGFVLPEPASVAELTTALDQSVARARAILNGMDEGSLADLWRVVDGDRDVMVMPVGGLLRSVMLNHWYHHRGQLAVYLRQVGALVPSIYGPSADENPFAAARTATAVSA